MASSGPAWVRFFVSDWLASTRGLKPTEAGILIHLLAMLHERGAPLPEDLDRLARRCGTTKPTLKRSIEMLIELGYLTRKDRALWTDKVQVEIDWRAEKSANGKTAAKERWKKDQQNQASSDATGMPDKSHSHSHRGGPKGRRSDETLSSMTESHSTSEVVEGDSFGSLPPLDEDHWRAIQEEDGDDIYSSDDEEEDDDFDDPPF